MNLASGVMISFGYQGENDDDVSISYQDQSVLTVPRMST